MTLNGQNVNLAEIKKFYGDHQKNLNEDRTILSVAKCRLMTLDRNIRYMRTLAGVPQGGGGKYNKCYALCPKFEQEHVYIMYK